MTNPAVDRRLDHPRIRSAFATIRLLLILLFAISLASVIFTIVAQSDEELVNPAVWIRSIAVAAAAIVLYAFAALAERGRTWAYRRLPLLAYLIPCGVVLLIVAPGEFPLWIKVEQAICGLLILTVGIILSRQHLRTLFPRPVK